MKKFHIFLIALLFFPYLVTATPTFAEEQKIFSNETTSSDRIELSKDNITLNVGDDFNPENYATAYRNDDEIPYGVEFIAIYNDVDTSKPGNYKVIYWLEDNIAGTYIEKTMNVTVQNNDRIELSKDNITLNVGDDFYPENYATAYRNDDEIPYGVEFIAIYNDVDTSKPGNYKVIYWLEDDIAGTYIEKIMSVTVQNKDTRLIPVLRSYNINDGDHLYTSSQEEYDWLIGLRWNAEGTAFNSVLSDYEGAIPVYRLYNPNSGEHFYTLSKKEYNSVASKGWTVEGVGFYMVPEDKGEAVYRVFDPNATGPGSHLYTSSRAEADWLVDLGWRDEGTAFYSAK
ncbi:immunoglobulin-like domain-containing protein [Enterococcus alishanensis]